VDAAYIGAARVDQVWRKSSGVGKITDNVVNEVHLVVGIDAGELYPFTAEDLVMREIGSEVQGNSEE
jgi:hypothetical protein